IYVNGDYRGAADQVLDLPAVAQSIEIRKDGYVTYQTRIIPRPGIAQEIAVTLKTLEQARRDAIKTEIQVAGDLTLKLFEPDGILMGASRREAGRRANEVIRQVAFSKRLYLS